MSRRPYNRTPSASGREPRLSKPVLPPLDGSEGNGAAPIPHRYDEASSPWKPRVTRRQKLAVVVATVIIGGGLCFAFWVFVAGVVAELIR